MQTVVSRNKINTNRNFRDMCKLTPYEEKMWELFQKGMTSRQIAAEMGAKSHLSINSRMKIIREKLESAGA